MYFFDIEDYRLDGFFGRQYSAHTATELNWDDYYTTFSTTKDAHFKAVNEYYLASIHLEEVSVRLDIFNANKTFCEKGELFKLKEIEFWQMMMSHKLDFLFNDSVISNGTIISVKYDGNNNSLSEEEKANGYAFDAQPWGTRYVFIQPEGTPLNLSGGQQYYYSIEAGNLFTIKYTQFDANIYNEYKSALQELMAAEKALIEVIDGEQTIIG